MTPLPARFSAAARAASSRGSDVAEKSTSKAIERAAAA
jgi:hypothetical protein